MEFGSKWIEMDSTVKASSFTIFFFPDNLDCLLSLSVLKSSIALSAAAAGTKHTFDSMALVRS